MVVQHNISAMNANRLFGINNSGLSKSLEKLSSGYAINRAGDNAAGLAVSEKMRAQISGLTQASKNAEDGISMVQTFEGALTETDSILQRMRTLAVQSANGTYQNDVDREAIQLEFDQLNDELNQIADTDFNGVVVLNGGQMADGLKQVNGEFNYANASRAAKQLSASDINKLDSQGIDDGVGDASNATKLWTDFGFNRTSTDTNKDNDGPDSVDVTFKYDSSKGTWSAISATGGANYKNIKVNTAANNGGFQVGSATTITAPDESSNLVNVVLDGTSLVNGDTITVTFNNPSVKNTAIENIGVSSADYSGLTVGTGTGATSKTANLKTEVTNTAVESTYGNGTTEMNADIKELFDRLDGATFTATYAADEANATGLKLTLTDKNGNVDNITADKTFKIGDTDFSVKVGDDGTFEIGLGATAGTIDTTLVKLTAAANTATDGSAGTISYTLAADTSKFTSATKPSASIAQPEGVVSKSNSNNASTATLTYQDNITLQTGARTKDSVNFTFSYESKGLGELNADLDCSARGLGTDKLSLADQEDANAAIDKIDNAINKVSMVRASFGAMQNRLEHKIANLDVNTENLTAAESRIRDTDMASEMTNFTKNQILSQASQAMLAQANQLPQGVLQLLG
ncbi:MAG: hypothetical protein J6A37_07825 [Oscillospiraceae bacterium]|nr:hypothetical protein [Oscillospiraceae bacterium]